MLPAVSSQSSKSILPAMQSYLPQKNAIVIAINTECLIFGFNRQVLKVISTFIGGLYSISNAHDLYQVPILYNISKLESHIYNLVCSQNVPWLRCNLKTWFTVLKRVANNINCTVFRRY